MNSSLTRVLKSTAKIAGIVIVSFLALGVLVSVFYTNEVKKMMLEQLNKNLDAEIKVQEFDFSILRHFPYATFDMKHLVMKEVTDKKNLDTLLYAEHLSLLFSMSEIFSNEFTIRKIVLKDGKAKIRVDESGRPNYHFWKSSSDSAGSSGINLKKIILDNIQVSYVDLYNKQDYLMLVKDGTLSGKFASELFTLNMKANLFVSHLLVDNINYVSGKEASIDSDLKVNNKTNEYIFGDSRVLLAGLLFDVKGSVVSLPETTRLNLAIDAHEAKLESFLSILPGAYVKYFKDFRSKGKFNFSCAIIGDLDAVKNPGVKVTFSIKDGKITPKESEVTLEQLNATGTFTNGSFKQKNKLEIPSLTAVLGGRVVKANLSVEDFSNPFLTFHATADLDLAQLRHFIKSDTLESLSGDLALNVSFAGKIKDLPRVHTDALYKVKASGNLELKNTSFKLKKNPLEFKNLNGIFSLHDNNVNVGSLKGNISSSDFQISGVFRNFITFLLIPGQDAEVDARLTSSEINLDELLVNKTSDENDTSYKLEFNPRLVCRLDVQIGNLHFRKFSATAFKGEIKLSDEIIRGNNLSFSSMDGAVVMDATINAARRDSVMMSCDAKCAKVDITKLFYQMENFFQSTMTDKNVKGKISAEVQFHSSWTTDLRINSKSAVATAGLTIENGELNDFRPILALSKYLKLSDLNHIKFSTLKNQVRISNRKIYIPNMEINSSALNISGSGTHDFDNMVDYKIQLLLSDILGKKVKDRNTEFGVVEDDGLGRTKLFLTMKGPVDDPVIGLDKKGVVAKIKTDFKADQQNLKSILKQEFGGHKKDSSLAQKSKGKKEEMQIDYDDK